MKQKVLLATLLSLLLVVQAIPLVFAAPIPVNFVTIDEYQHSNAQTTLIDVRSKNSRERSNLIIPGSVWIDPQSGPALQNFIATADKNKSYTLFCSCVDDNYSIRAAELLIKNGYQNVYVLKGGWDAISSSEIEVVPLK